MIKLTLSKNAKAPTYESEGAAGADLYALTKTGGMCLAPGERAVVPTGIRMAIPQGYEVQIRPRSGLAAKHGVTVLNAPGTIDSDYRGEVGVILINHGKTEFYIQDGDRIAQMVYAKVEQTKFDIVEELDETRRGEGGFGSTGK